MFSKGANLNTAKAMVPTFPRILRLILGFVCVKFVYPAPHATFAKVHGDGSCLDVEGRKLAWGIGLHYDHRYCLQLIDVIAPPV